MFQVTERLEKTKNKMLILSGVSLFISLTETLPDKVTALGLDLSAKEAVFGWFIFIISSYFLIRFAILSVVALIEHYLPDFISTKISKTTGDTIGLTADECFENENQDDYEIGTVSGEMNEINKKNEIIQRVYNARFVKFSDFITLTCELFGPVAFAIVSISYLYCFLT